MNKNSLTFLKQLMATPTPTGFETRGQEIVSAYMGQFADDVRMDVHGSVHGVMNPGRDVRVMLAGHCDEIGLMVQHIDDKGYLTMSALGGVTVPLLQGERILIQTAKGPIPGVFGVKPIHMLTDEDRKNPVNLIHDLWVDIGAKNKKDAEKMVALGDTATINSGWIELTNGKIACRGFDNRIGVFVISEVLRLLHGHNLNVSVHAVSTVQEEVGLRGSRTSAYAVDPQIGIAVDVGFATDFPGMNAKIAGEAKVGEGPILHPGPTYNPTVLEMLKKAASKSKIKTQIQPEARGTGTDAFSIQMTRGGVAAGLVSIPCRYMHSPVETIALSDAEDAAKVIATFIEHLTGNEKLR
ncbi:MAG TPA: hydrolase [Verrucomicrobia bacterium]|nr:hydrolase [Verrucomicrobiota bacterium]